ncbi:hypothetical protein C1894_16915 [Pseudomonas sp. FW305-3-2-15-E-TSA2]|nr:hypothetical protein C1895_16795 [Pseudomonas sp. FW305-3-2-15-E-TSA4]POA41050.1 hypothetical protein C1894_16915 [Pseudomonas sp. FW305-3-2-15-E-TSA2]
MGNSLCISASCVFYGLTFVGVSLLAIAVGQSTWMLNVMTPSRAGSLLQGDICGRSIEFDPSEHPPEKERQKCPPVCVATERSIKSVRPFTPRTESPTCFQPCP